MALLTEAVQEVVQPSEAPSGVCREKDDDNELACAVEASADYLVTGDNDLLEMKRFKHTRIITPRDFELLFDN